MFCPNCGKFIDDRAVICPYCGVEIVRRNVPENESNGSAVAGFILSLFIPFLGLIFSIIGLKKANEIGGNGKGLAVAGIIISILSIAIYIFTLIPFIMGILSSISSSGL